MSEEGGENDAVALVLTSARLLLVNGFTTERTIRSVERLGESLGLAVALFPGWGQTLIRLQAPGQPARLEVLAAPPIGVDMRKVTGTLRILGAVARHAMTPAEALAALERIGQIPPISLARFAGFAAACSAALAVIFGSAESATLLIAFLSAGAGAVLRRGLAHVSSNFLLQPLGAALLAGLAAAMAARFLPAQSIFVIALCPCMVLVPGPHLLNGVYDLARLRIGFGAMRLCYAGLIILLISVGLLATLTLGGQSLPLSGPDAAATPLIYDVLAAGVAVAAYGAFFAMPWRMLPLPILVGMTSHALHWWAGAWGASASLAALLSCLFVSTAVTPAANRQGLSSAAVAFASVAALIPGSFLFRMTSALYSMLPPGGKPTAELLTAATVDGAMAAAIMVAMAFGLILPKMLIEAVAPPTYPG